MINGAPDGWLSSQQVFVIREHHSPYLFKTLHYVSIVFLESKNVGCQLSLFSFGKE